jgi:6-hydroxycyclohex-1-ene-1-carbonyl-CoA dehydrogenase
MQVTGWTFEEPGKPMRRLERTETPLPGEVIVEVAGCGVCHTDLGFAFGGVKTRHELPLTLGHEISGTVVETAEDAREWEGRRVVVPAVIPCGKCHACEAGRGSICPTQVFPGNDVHGGFATHVRVPAHGLCPVPDLDDAEKNPHGVSLSSLSVIADAVSTPYQAIVRSGLAAGDLAIFVGAGGVGGFGIQIAAAKGAKVVAIDIDPQRLEGARASGALLCIDSKSVDFRALKKSIKDFAKEQDIPTYRWRIFETSGTTPGQSTAFGLVAHGSYLSLVGFTPKKLELRLSNLMAFDAIAEGNWGCLPKYYPEIVDMVLAGDIVLEPFVEHRPLDSINETFDDVKEHRCSKRIILTP